MGQARMQNSSRYLMVIVAVVGFLPAAFADEKDSQVYPTTSWSTATPQSLGMRAAPLRAARDYASNRGGAGIITRHGKIVMSWGDTKKKFDLKSSSKSIGVTSLGLAIDDKNMAISDRHNDHQPKNA
jgi:hypothetical protein